MSAELPDLNPIAARLIGGREGQESLKRRLLELAAQTDDEGYAHRLRQIADGRRPVRSILTDPSFLAGPTGDADLLGPFAERDAATPDESQAFRQDAAGRIAGLSLPSPEEAAAILPEIERLAARARMFLEEDRLTGFQGSLEHLARLRDGRAQGETEDSDENPTYEPDPDRVPPR